MDPWDDQPDGLGADVELAGPGGGRDVALRPRRRANGPRAHQLDLRGARAHIHALDVQTSRTSQARRCQPRCHRSTRAEARVCLAAVRGGTDNFTDFTDVIAAEMKGRERDGTRMAVGAEMTPRSNPSAVCSC